MIPARRKHRAMLPSGRTSPIALLSPSNHLPRPLPTGASARNISNTVVQHRKLAYPTREQRAVPAFFSCYGKPPTKYDAIRLFICYEAVAVLVRSRIHVLIRVERCWKSEDARYAPHVALLLLLRYDISTSRGSWGGRWYRNDYSVVQSRWTPITACLVIMTPGRPGIASAFQRAYPVFSVSFL